MDCYTWQLSVKHDLVTEEQTYALSETCPFFFLKQVRKTLAYKLTRLIRKDRTASVGFF